MHSSTTADQHFLIPGQLLPRRRDEVLEDTSMEVQISSHVTATSPA